MEKNGAPSGAFGFPHGQSRDTEGVVQHKICRFFNGVASKFCVLILLPDKNHSGERKDMIL